MERLKVLQSSIMSGFFYHSIDQIIEGSDFVFVILFKLNEKPISIFNLLAQVLIEFIFDILEVVDNFDHLV